MHPRARAKVWKDATDATGVLGDWYTRDLMLGVSQSDVHCSPRSLREVNDSMIRGSYISARTHMSALYIAFPFSTSLAVRNPLSPPPHMVSKRILIRYIQAYMN